METGPDGQFTPHVDGFAGSVDLIHALKSLGDFDVTVAAYPNRHPDAGSDSADVDHLKAKFRCRGGSRNYPIFL